MKVTTLKVIAFGTSIWKPYSKYLELIVNRIKYQIKIEDSLGLKSLTIESPTYLSGRKNINIKGKKRYLHEEVIVVSPKTEIIEKPYIRVTAKNLAGKISHSNIVPLIEMIK